MTAIASFKMAMAFLQETKPIAAVIAHKPECPVAQGNVDAVTKNADNPSGVYRFVFDRKTLRAAFFCKNTRRRFLKCPSAGELHHIERIGQIASVEQRNSVASRCGHIYLLFPNLE
jgi:hypothetical protein